MPRGLDRLNALSEKDAIAALMRCCGSSRWAERVARRRPFTDETALFSAAEDAWRTVSEADRLEAFAHHPRIGERAAGEAQRATAAWSSREQSGMNAASENARDEFARLNVEYEQRFGFVFLICATGSRPKSCSPTPAAA